MASRCDLLFPSFPSWEVTLLTLKVPPLLRSQGPILRNLHLPLVAVMYIKLTNTSTYCIKINKM